MIKGRSLIGKVVSAKMTKTVIVEVAHTHAHILYKKRIRKNRRFAAHNTLEGVSVGDTVKISEVPPIARTKHFIVAEKI